MKTTRLSSSVLRWSSLVIASLVSLCCATDAGAYTTGEFLPGVNSSNNYSCVVLGPSNVFYGGWKCNPTVTTSQMKFATYNGSSWTEIPGSGFTGTDSAAQLGSGINTMVDWNPEAMAVDGSGNIHIVYGVGVASGGSPGLRGLAYGKFTATTSTWAFRKLFILQDPNGWKNTGDYCMKLDSSGNPHVVFIWADVNDDPIREAHLKYAFFNGTVWNVSGNTNAFDGLELDISDGNNSEGVAAPDIVFDSLGNIHCSYSKEDSPANTAGDCWYIKKTGATWGTGSEVGDLNNYTWGSIAVDSSNNVHIASRFVGASSTNPVTYRVTTNASGSWATSNVATYSFPGAATVSSGDVIMKINSAGKRVIVNTVKGNTSIGNSLRVVYENTSGTWVQEEAASAAGTLTLNFPSMALRNSDNTIMVLHSRQVDSSNRNVYYATGIPTDFGGAPAGTAVTSLNRVSATPTNASSVSWTLTFASAVTGVTATNFSVSGAGATGTSIGTPTTSNAGLSWTIPVTTNGDGLLTLNLANSTGLSTISTTLPYAGESYTIDKSPPTVLTVTRQTPSFQTTNQTTVVFRVTYSEPVTLNAPESGHFVVVPVGGSDIVGSVTGVTGTGATRDVTVSLTSGLGEFRLRVLD